MLGVSQQALWCGQWHAEPDGANKKMQQEGELSNDIGSMQEKHFHKNGC
jgi:hypothetical protein